MVEPDGNFLRFYMFGNNKFFNIYYSQYNVYNRY